MLQRVATSIEYVARVCVWRGCSVSGPLLTFVYPSFSNSLIIHQVNITEIKTVTPVLISIEFYDFISSFTPKFLFWLRRYIKHSRQCFIRFPNTSNFVKILRYSDVPMKHFLPCLIYYFTARFLSKVAEFQWFPFQRKPDQNALRAADPMREPKFIDNAKNFELFETEALKDSFIYINFINHNISSSVQSRLSELTTMNNLHEKLNHSSLLPSPRRPRTPLFSPYDFSLL